MSIKEFKLNRNKIYDSSQSVDEIIQILLFIEEKEGLIKFHQKDLIKNKVHLNGTFDKNVNIQFWELAHDGWTFFLHAILESNDNTIFQSINLQADPFNGIDYRGVYHIIHSTIAYYKNYKA